MITKVYSQKDQLLYTRFGSKHTRCADLLRKGADLWDRAGSINAKKYIEKWPKNADDVHILDRFDSHLYNQSEWVNSFTVLILLYFLYLLEVYALCISVYVFHLCFWDDCMPRNLPISNKPDLKENSCVSFGAGWFRILILEVL